MSEQILCHACQAFLDGAREAANFDGSPPYKHHSSADSLKSALTLGCAICTSLFGAYATLGSTSWARDKPIEQPVVESWVFEFHIDCDDYFPNQILVLEDAAAKSGPCGKPIRGNSGGEDALAFFASQYDVCRTTHTTCPRWAPSSHFFPSRVIDVGCRGDAEVCLRVANTIDAPQPYLTLSHCWGQSQPFTLTNKTVAQLERGIPVVSLPQTFHDAILVTRRLNFRYLWIDSLCIFQDNLDDWHTEAGQMSDIYGNATCCIAATSAKDCNTGLFIDREPHALEPIKIKITESRSLSSTHLPPPGLYWASFRWTNYNAIDHAPLNQRAWVAQERYLSSRVMHFSREVLFWECFERFANEASSNGIPYKGGFHQFLPSISSLKTHVFGMVMGLSPARQAPNAEQVTPALLTPTCQFDYDRWKSFLGVYTQYLMTKEADCLVALSGIAQNIEMVTNDRFVAGLWRGNLLEDLCWQAEKYEIDRDRSSRPTTWRAPSWSWASLNIPLSTNYHWAYVSDTDKAEILDCLVDAEPSGQIKSASITLRCRLIPVAVRIETNEGFDRAFAHIGLRSRSSIEVEIDDWSTAASRTAGTNIWLLVLRDIFLSGDGGLLEGLVIVLSTNRPPSFERIGMFSHVAYPDSKSEVQDHPKLRAYEELLEKYKETEEKVVELV
ncbi:HET-domain-containing protein [Ophiobolus disseminans]|uniref:HET-domain-containing protein n=1 Tax=Ophiobolus disseminans TaxID=1469910 RepID=A0A6A7AAL8_9PLEO|nr:HET-domain-containing protein [Ophiobolus disseminans]